MAVQFPTSQGELIKRARGEKTQSAFAKELGVDRTCLSRYESEKLGASTKVLNYCLRAIAAHAGQSEAAPLSRRWSMSDRQSISWNVLPSPNVVTLDW